MDVMRSLLKLDPAAIEHQLREIGAVVFHFFLLTFVLLGKKTH
jgi:hypothetical protein